MKIIAIVAAIASGIFLSFPMQQATAQTEVDVELVLAVDVSRSMTIRELEIQRRGYAEALTSKEVITAIQNGLIGRVAITYIEWAGTNSQRTIVDWSMVSNLEEATQFADQISAHFDGALRRTSISGALDFSSRLFGENEFVSNRQVIDVSGDGPNNMGSPVLTARERTLAKNITINGLPLMTREGMGSQFQLEDLDEYYKHCVIGGPGSFVIPVYSWEEFPRAVRQKLVLELAGNSLTPPAQSTLVLASATNYDCLIGEKIWDSFRNRMLFP